MSATKIQHTKNYALFVRHIGENRRFDPKKHKKLKESMQKYGFLKCFPVVIRRTGDLLEVKDGQHRMAIAEELGLPVFWVEEEIDFDVAVVNSTAKVWQTRDYAQKFADNGMEPYQEGLDFADRHGLSVGLAFSLLGGHTAFTNIQKAFIDGNFKVKDRDWAESVAGLYGPLVVMAPGVKSARLLEACMAACRVPSFDPKRLLAGASRCREKLVSYSTRDAYLDMMEAVYNYGRRDLVGLKSAAVMAMRGRNPAEKKRLAKGEKKKKEVA